MSGLKDDGWWSRDAKFASFDMGYRGLELRVEYELRNYVLAPVLAMRRPPKCYKVTLIFLEEEIIASRERYGTLDEAKAAAITLARKFVTNINHRLEGAEKEC